MVKLLILIPCLGLSVYAGAAQRVYEIWEAQPVPNRGGTFEKPSVGNGTPFDKDREEWSYPIGNGYNIKGETYKVLPE